jgi:hypothetical protein
MITGEVQTKADELFAQGVTSVNKVAIALKVDWKTAKRFKDEWEAKHGIVRALSTTVEAVSEEEDVQAWEVSLSVPTARIDDMLLAFTRDEKLDAIQFVIQQRIDATLQPAT